MAHLGIKLTNDTLHTRRCAQTKMKRGTRTVKSIASDAFASQTMTNAWAKNINTFTLTTMANADKCQ